MDNIKNTGLESNFFEELNDEEIQSLVGGADGLFAGLLGGVDKAIDGKTLGKALDGTVENVLGLVGGLL